ncbi:helix-turn-helix domain-containing protein [uncultured Paludibaculum sp.]|uniref:helix-turn-helix domain-containing protein n=1 Tax=uncultured Paludibaculum sp. TaxID=1765020 RepID=UPI002AABA899|nr:helix-turn-helix domain-containing protein [uncultured Paludibaculum sp.]
MTHAEQVAPAYLRLQDSAKFTGLSPSMIRKLSREGKIPKARVGSAVCYPVAALRTFMESARTERPRLDGTAALVESLGQTMRDGLIPQPGGTFKQASLEQRLDAAIRLLKLLAPDGA